MVEDGLGREGGADRVLLSPGVARHRAHRDDAELEVLKAGEQVGESPASQCAWADGVVAHLSLDLMARLAQLLRPPIQLGRSSSPDDVGQPLSATRGADGRA